MIDKFGLSSRAIYLLKVESVHVKKVSSGELCSMQKHGATILAQPENETKLPNAQY